MWVAAGRDSARTRFVSGNLRVGAGGWGFGKAKACARPGGWVPERLHEFEVSARAIARFRAFLLTLGYHRRDSIAGGSMADPLNTVNFHCRACGNRFEADPTVRDEPSTPWHPYAYSTECPECGAEAQQADWQRSLLKAWSSATGPKTPEGKAASAANLVGHPTPEEALRTRFNRLTHGLYSRVATFFPARPGKYPHCEGCEYRYDVCGVSAPACLKRTELYLRHHIAFETRDPGFLMEMRSDTQAGIQALINDMILIIAQDGGPRLKSPEWYTDKESGDVNLVEWTDEFGERQRLMKFEAHPLLKHLMDFISKNTMTLADMGMTPKVQAEEEAQLGHLEQDRKDRETMTDFQRRQQQQTERLMDLIERGASKRAPALIIQDQEPPDG